MQSLGSSSYPSEQSGAPSHKYWMEMQRPSVGQRNGSKASHFKAEKQTIDKYYYKVVFSDPLPFEVLKKGQIFSLLVYLIIFHSEINRFCVWSRSHIDVCKFLRNVFRQLVLFLVCCIISLIYSYFSAKKVTEQVRFFPKEKLINWNYI